MTVLTTVLLAVGMAVVGVHVLAIVATPLGALVITRISHESMWDVYMTMWSQLVAAAVTFSLGYIVLGLPWYAALIAGLLVGVTTYARRAPDSVGFDFGTAPDDPGYGSPASDLDYGWSDDSEQAEPHTRERNVECPTCGKWMVDTQALGQHVKAKHGLA